VQRGRLRSLFAGVTPLFLAAAVAGAGGSSRSGRDAASVVRALLAAGAAVDAADAASGMTPLAAAAAGGAQWETLDEVGWYEDTRGAAAAVVELLRGGAAVGALDKGGRTPLHYALQVGGAKTLYRKNFRGDRPADVVCALLAAAPAGGELDEELPRGEAERAWAALRARVELRADDGEWEAAEILRAEMEQRGGYPRGYPSAEFSAIVARFIREESEGKGAPSGGGGGSGGGDGGGGGGGAPGSEGRAPSSPLEAALRARAHFRYGLPLSGKLGKREAPAMVSERRLGGALVSFAAFEYLHFAYAYGEQRAGQEQCA
jgi:hypothetical protein